MAAATADEKLLVGREHQGASDGADAVNARGFQDELDAAALAKKMGLAVCAKIT